MKSGTTLRLILGDQLNTQHSWFLQVRADILYTLMEVRQETDAVRLHIQKVAGFFSAMRHFADVLARMGHRVVYLRLDDPNNDQSFDANLIRLIREQHIARFEYMQPDDYRLDGQLARLAAHLSIPSTVVDTEHFLTGSPWAPDTGYSDSSPDGGAHTDMGRIGLPATGQAFHIAVIWSDCIFLITIVARKSIAGRRCCHEMVYQNGKIRRHRCIHASYLSSACRMGRAGALAA